MSHWVVIQELRCRRCLLALSALVLACCTRFGYHASNPPGDRELGLRDLGLLDRALAPETSLGDAVTADLTPPIPDIASLDSAPSPCAGAFALKSSAQEPGGEHLVVVTPLQTQCVYRFVVKGAGGGYAESVARGGHGGLNSFDFVPGQAGVLILTVGGGGTGDPQRRDGGSGASSVVFDPDATAGRGDAFTLSIAGGGGGEGGDAGSGSCENGGDGNGDGAGGAGQGGYGSSGGNGACNVWGDCCGGTCSPSALCQGGRGGAGAVATSGGVPGGFGKGGGKGGDASFGGGGGGGYGGAGGSRYNGSGGGGGGKVFTVVPPAPLLDTTDPAKSLGGGGRGGDSTRASGEDGSIALTVGG